MIKNFFITLFMIILVIVLALILINVYKNNPQLIAKSLKKQIELSRKSEFKTHRDWLWSETRAFIFDVVYMNIFSPGIAKMQILSETTFKNSPVYILEALLEPNDFFKKIYDANMKISSAVRKKDKVSLWYQEISITPEKSRTKEIVFEPQNNIAIREGMKFRIPDGINDPLSVFFNLLNADFIIGEPIVLNLLSKEEIYEFKATPLELRNNIYKLEGEVHRQDRSSTHSVKFTIWVLDGQVRIPLLAKIVSAAGPIYIRLKNLK